MRSEDERFPGWARALLRLAAVAWFLVALWPLVPLARDVPTAGRSSETCTAVGTIVLQLVLALAGVAALLTAGSTVRTRRRVALVAAVVLLGAWIVVLTLFAWELPGQRCSSG